MYQQFGSAVKRAFSSENDFVNNNILETNHHREPIFEKIDAEKYFRITVRKKKQIKTLLKMQETTIKYS